MRTETVTEYLKYDFSEQELKDKAKQLAHEFRQKEEAELESKEGMSLFKSRIDAHKANVSRLSNHINNGYEYRNIECDVLYNTPLDGQKTIVRKDTREIIRMEEMQPEEFQESLAL